MLVSFFCSQRLLCKIALNMGYWLVLSGVNMTLLPMILVDPSFGLTPVEVGGVFAGMSAVRVVMNCQASVL